MRKKHLSRLLVLILIVSLFNGCMNNQIGHSNSKDDKEATESILTDNYINAIEPNTNSENTVNSIVDESIYRELVGNIISTTWDCMDSSMHLLNLANELKYNSGRSDVAVFNVFFVETEMSYTRLELASRLANIAVDWNEKVPPAGWDDVHQNCLELLSRSALLYYATCSVPDMTMQEWNEYCTEQVEIMETVCENIEDSLSEK